ncbi:hypothetical protein G4T00_000755 [Campylobacter jejuni]|nr:hypothetical protein [Campylobacter jejuni]EAI3875630.1 hypothetical protein [Campylobacter jejuni]EAK1068571.1 hypothetical protein [Campylobacter jejuni]EDP2624044.1 hypothetical protein [Campylobacter jejuni]EEA7652658.1 hypothetical protein [Campylobacter jejuni]
MTDFRNLAELEKIFYTTYDIFAQVDTILSLTKHGKKSELIKMVMIFYLKILSSKKSSNEQKITAFESIREKLEEYIIQCEKKYKRNFSSDLPKAQINNKKFIECGVSVKNFSDALINFIRFRQSLSEEKIKTIAKINLKNRVKYYFDFNDDNFISEIVDKFYNKNGSFNIPKQALIEFHNFMSHICAAYKSQNIEVQNKNIERAKNHLYRGTLDIYKIIIKDYIISSNEIINERHIRVLFNLRLKEYRSLGKNNFQINILKYFKKIGEEIVNLKRSKLNNEKTHNLTTVSNSSLS